MIDIIFLTYIILQYSNTSRRIQLSSSITYNCMCVCESIFEKFISLVRRQFTARKLVQQEFTRKYQSARKIISIIHLNYCLRVFRIKNKKMRHFFVNIKFELPNPQPKLYRYSIVHHYLDPSVYKTHTEELSFDIVNKNPCVNAIFITYLKLCRSIWLLPWKLQQIEYRMQISIQFLSDTKS